MASHQQGQSKTGLSSARVRDLDIAAARPRLPPRALPDDVRASLGLSAAGGGGGGGVDGSVAAVASATAAAAATAAAVTVAHAAASTGAARKATHTRSRG